MYRVVIKQLQLSFLSILTISLSFLTSTVLFDSFFPSPPFFIHSLSPLFSSFWTLSRCACGNFPGVIFAALLARSLTSLNSVYPRRHFSRSPSVPRHSSASLTPRSYSRPISRFSFPRSTWSDVAEAPHLSTCTPLTFSLPFPFFTA